MTNPSLTDFVVYSHLDEHRELRNRNRYAAAIVFDILDRFLTIDSVLDLGCGIGVWMQAAMEKPGRQVFGIDLEAFDPDELAVPAKSIIQGTVDRTLSLHRRFDLALCLETAEHIRSDCASEVVSNCVRHSDVVLFSAAIPGQGGLDHINEQPPEYWQDLFDLAGYEVIDLIRPLIWRDAGIPAWYRQNMLLFVNRKAAWTLDLLRAEACKTSTPLHRAHPDLFYWQAQELGRRQEELKAVPSARDITLAQPIDARTLAGRAEELQADLQAQREYSARTVSEVWRLMHKMHAEREAERSQLRMMESDLDWLVEHLATVEGALARAERAKVEFVSSISWQLTAPLRAAGEVLLRLKRWGGR